MHTVLGALASAAAFLSLSSPAWAQQDEPASTPGATAVSRDDAQWKHAYTVARERLLAGDFADAAARFDELSRDPGAAANDRMLAAEMRDIARSWDSRGLTLVKRNDLGESALPARSVNERTTDEIAQLYAASVLYGLGTGLWIDAHTQPTSTAGVILPMLIFGGVSVGGVALLDINHPLHYGVAQSAVSGLYLGLEEGLLLSLWNQTQPNSTSQWPGSAVADVIWTLSTVGMVGGGVLGNSLGATPGRASFVGSTGLWAGVLTGFAGAAFTGSGQNRAPNAMLAADIGLNVGIVGGLLTAGPVSPSIARVRFLDLGGIGGGLLAGGLYLAAANTGGNAQAAFGVTAVGIAAGLGIAWVATGRIPPDRPEERSKPDALLLEPMLVPVQGGATIGVHGLL
jgi:hypothetical protein